LLQGGFDRHGAIGGHLERLQQRFPPRSIHPHALISPSLDRCSLPPPGGLSKMVIVTIFSLAKLRAVPEAARET
jgi:hypothetical protein